MSTTAGQLVIGSLTAPGLGSPFQPIGGKLFNVFLTGTFVATVTLQRSYDGGVTYQTVLLPDAVTAATYTAAANFEVLEPDSAVLYAWNCTAYTSGTINYRLG